MAAISAYLNGSTGTDRTGIRKYLNDQGYKDDQIGYDNGNVTLNGKSFYNATPDADGSTYASAGALQGALKQYNSANNSSMANNLNNTMYNNVTSKPFEFKQQQSPFTYDPNSDQAYQAALRSAQANIQTGQNNTMANLLAHGQGNSSYAATATQQVANREMNNVSNNILPQLIQQAYQRYQDQNNNDYRTQLANYNAGQDQLKNQSSLANYLNGLGQQDIDNQYRDNALAENIKQNNWNAYKDSVAMTGDLGTGAKSDYSLLGNLSGNLSLQGQQFKANQDQQAIENKFKQQQMEQQAQQFAASQGLQWANLNQRQKEFVAEQAMKQKQLDAQNDPNNLDNQYKKAQIEALTNKNAQTADHGIDEYDLALIDGMAAQKGVDFSKPETIKSFVADLKAQHGWTTDEAKQVESYLGSKANSSAQGSSGSFFQPLNLDTLRDSANNLSLDFMNNMPGADNSSPGYIDYLKELAKKSNPMNLFK